MGARELLMIAVAVGLVTYNNTPDELADFIHSLERSVQYCSVPMSCDLYVIHNGHSVLLPEPKPSLRIHVLPSVGNVGFGPGMNALMERAYSEGKTVFLTSNPDGQYHYDFFNQILPIHLENPEAIVEGEQFPEDHPKTYSPDDLTTDWASGCAMMIPKKIYENVGGFDEKIFMYIEDVDLSIRARDQGFLILHAPRALFAHKVLDRESNGAGTQKFYFQSALYVAAKYGQWPFYSMYKKFAQAEGIHVDSHLSWRLFNPILYFRYRKYFRYYFSFAEVRW